MTCNVRDSYIRVCGTARPLSYFPGSWHLDEDSERPIKNSLSNAGTNPCPELTFIVLSRSSVQKGLDVPTADGVARMKMIGDVNMFFKDEGEVECEIMIAGK